MAIKALLLRKKIKDAQQALDAERAKEPELVTREAELTAAIDEAETDEERAAVEESVAQLEADQQAHKDALAQLERTVTGLEDELRDTEEQNEQPEEQGEEQAEERHEERKKEMIHRSICGLTRAESAEFVQRDDVKSMLTAVRTAIAEKRAITNAGYLIPDVVIGLIRENIMEYSKLYKHANVRRIPGTGRMVIMGSIPEAVWTEACATLNELDLAFSQVEVDGYKVGGYFRICNAALDDSDIDLAAELVAVLGQAIGYALDKAILFGSGTKMPVGVLKALEGVTGTPNIVSHAASVVDTALIKALVADTALINGKYSRGEKVWAMNEGTYMTLVANSLAVNAAGAIVSGTNGVMPVVGGVIEVLNFIPDNVIIGGYFDLYLLAERAGTAISTSEHAFWIEDQTGFKGTARYDGKVLDTDAFVAIGLNGVTPATSGITFAEDTANAGE